MTRRSKGCLLAIAVCTFIASGCARRAQVAQPPASPANTQPGPVKKRTVPVQPKASSTRKPAEDPAPATTGPMTLGEIVNEQQETAYQRSIDNNIARARSNLKQLTSVALNLEQQKTVLRIEGFLRQAAEARAMRDYTGALTLSERAYLLSRELLTSQ